MPKMHPDANAKPIPALLPTTTATVNGTSDPLPAGIVRLCSTADALYAVNGTAAVLLPAGVVEYIRVEVLDTISTDVAVNVTVMD